MLGVLLVVIVCYFKEVMCVRVCTWCDKGNTLHAMCFLQMIFYGS